MSRGQIGRSERVCAPYTCALGLCSHEIGQCCTQHLRDAQEKEFYALSSVSVRAAAHCAARRCDGGITQALAAGVHTLIRPLRCSVSSFICQCKDIRKVNHCHSSGRQCAVSWAPAAAPPRAPAGRAPGCAGPRPVPCPPARWSPPGAPPCGCCRVRHRRKACRGGRSRAAYASGACTPSGSH